MIFMNQTFISSPPLPLKFRAAPPANGVHIILQLEGHRGSILPLPTRVFTYYFIDDISSNMHRLRVIVNRYIRMYYIICSFVLLNTNIIAIVRNIFSARSVSFECYCLFQFFFFFYMSVCQYRRSRNANHVSVILQSSPVSPRCLYRRKRPSAVR